MRILRYVSYACFCGALAFVIVKFTYTFTWPHTHATSEPVSQVTQSSENTSHTTPENVRIWPPVYYIVREEAGVPHEDVSDADASTYYVEEAPPVYMYVSLPARNPTASDIDAAISWLRSQGVENDFVYAYLYFEIRERFQKGYYTSDQACTLLRRAQELEIDTYHNIITDLDEGVIKRAIAYMHAQYIPHDVRLHKMMHDMRYLALSGVYDYETVSAWYQYAHDYECRLDLKNLNEGMQAAIQSRENSSQQSAS